VTGFPNIPIFGEACLSEHTITGCDQVPSYDKILTRNLDYVYPQDFQNELVRFHTTYINSDPTPQSSLLPIAEGQNN
jgi:hypothetical protein